MSKSQSVYLDLLRLVAAVVVMLSHLARDHLSGGFLWQLMTAGHDGVIVFFVLSGYVITFVADTRERNATDYALSRLTRLYSVLLPALLLTFVADSIGMMYAPHFYLPETHSEPLLRFASAALFLSQSWHLSQPYSNAAYWSLPFEFWYYVMFGAFIYLRGAIRYVALAVAAAIAGPTILLLFPVWLFGVFSFRARKLDLSARYVWPLFAVSFAGMAVMVLPDLTGHGHAVTLQGWEPGASPRDYALGALVAINLFAGSFLTLPFARIGRAIRYLAGMTFSLYLFHLPLLFLFAACLPLPHNVFVRGPIMAVLVLLACEGLSHLTERRNGDLKRLLSRRLGLRMKVQPA